MTDKINDGGPAFPGWKDTPDHESGMSMRDYFAAHETLPDFSQELLEKHIAEALAGPMPEGGWGGKQPPEHYRAMLAWEAKWRAELKYIRADAMIKARGAR